jgi:3-dehydroquinate dehydratase-1
MPKPQVKLKLPAGGGLVIGLTPRVAGVLSSLPGKPFEASEMTGDLIEMRLDQLDSREGWLASCRAIQEAGVPVLLTIRSQTEGGKWSGTESERLKLYEEGLSHLAMVDVELQSAIAVDVAAAAKRQGKACVFSYHNFERTPETGALRDIIKEAQEIASIVKISAMAKTEQDVVTLRGLLNEKWNTPLCVIAMGPFATPTRVSFAIAGSCLAFGYLDRPSAPGQLSAAELVRQIRDQDPAFSR